MYTTTAYFLPLGAIGTKCWDFIRRIYYIFIQNNMKGFPGGSVVKNLPAKAGDMGSMPGSGRSPIKGNGNPL